MATKNEECPGCGSLEYEDAHLKGNGEYVFCVECGTVRKLLEVE